MGDLPYLCVRDVMSEPPYLLDPKVSAVQAAQGLLSRGFSSAPVQELGGPYLGALEEEKLIDYFAAPHDALKDPERRGWFWGSSSDIGMFEMALEVSRGRRDMKRVLDHLLEVEKASVRDLMDPRHPTVLPSDPLTKALRLIHDGPARHLPVVETGRCVGVVTSRDLVRALVPDDGRPQPSASSPTAPEGRLWHPRSEVLTLPSDVQLGQAVLELERARFSSAPVLNQDTVVGLLILEDLFDRGTAPKGWFAPLPLSLTLRSPQAQVEALLDHIKRVENEPVEFHMRKAPTVRPTAGRAEIAAVLGEQHLRAVAVTEEDGTMVGLATRALVLKDALGELSSSP